jgi:hypothetical protein
VAAPVVDGHLIGHQRVLGADAQDRAVRHDAVVTLFTALVVTTIICVRLSSARRLS